ncbi:MAG: aminoacetone oxidase family FAD-binding enzyme [Bacteroidales bacterium]|nr:aminoacetone oxidase family FAD-binding enzyme [Bacteroidales bacterium]
MMLPRLAIVGGGPAGMMAAIRAAATLGDGSRVVLFDKNERLGRKIYLTGKGRCNMTNLCPWEEFSTHLYPDKGFLRFAFRAFSNEALIRFFEDELGVPTVTLQGRRVYPASLVAGDVARALERRVRELGVDVRYGTAVGSLAELDGFGAVIVATGGLSYPVTGSTGDGYRFAEEAGHTVTTVFPSETALRPEGYDAGLPGLEMKNVGLELRVGGSTVQSEQGDFNFTDDGLESGIAYKLSRRAVWALVNGQRVDIVLDLKPALSEDQLANRLRRSSGADSLRLSRPDKATLRSLMPEALTGPFLRANPGLTEADLPQRLKSWKFHITDYKGYERAVVTAGGVSLKEVVPRTMSSRLRPGLYFCGEVLDLDGDTGGYNLQIAFSSGSLAGASAAKYLSDAASI